MNRKFTIALARAVKSGMKANEDVRTLLKQLTIDIGATERGDEECEPYKAALTEAGRQASSDFGIARFAFGVLAEHKSMVDHPTLYSKGIMTACNNAAQALKVSPEKVVGLALKKFGSEFTATEVKAEWPLIADPKANIEKAIKAIEKSLPLVSESDARMIRETLASI